MKFTLTNKLIAVNILLFAVFFSLSFFSEGLIDYIALRPSAILHGEYLWTIVTSMFMHADLMHLFVNMISLLFIGNLVERLIGTRRYLSLYIISGVFASLFFILIALVTGSGLDALAVGASGAIFGLGGVLMFLTPNLPVYLMFIPIPVKMKYAIPALLFALWAISLTAGLNIGNTAHLGGLIVGLAYGLYLRVKYKKRVLVINRYFR
jgi:membrane associated rhomboid family serine protease